MAVEVGKPTTGDISAELNIVGNLIGAATVDVVPRTGGRLVVGQRQARRPGEPRPAARQDRGSGDQRAGQAGRGVAPGRAGHDPPARSRPQVRRGQPRTLARTCSSASCCPASRSTTPRRASSAAAAQLDLARAQFAQAQARLDELRINLANTSITSPVNGFVGKRNVDPGAWASNQAPVVSVVDISSVRLVANVVEKDLRLVNVGDPARVEVDAFPGETFNGRIARVAPVLDPATRTAEIEIEVPNADFRLKPGHVRPDGRHHREPQGHHAGAEGGGRRLRQQARRLHDDRREQGEVPADRDRASRTRPGSRCGAASPSPTRSSPPAPRRCGRTTRWSSPARAAAAGGPRRRRAAAPGPGSQGAGARRAAAGDGRAAAGPETARRPAGTVTDRRVALAAAAAVALLEDR